MAGTGIVFYLFTLCDDLGFTASVPTSLFKTLGLTMLATQLVGGVLADFLPLNRLPAIGTIMISAGLWAVAFGQTEPLGIHLQHHLGQGRACCWQWARHRGLLRPNPSGFNCGTVWCCTVAGSGCGSLFMGTRDFHGNFEPALYFFLGLMTFLSVLAFLATSLPSRLRRLISCLFMDLFRSKHAMPVRSSLI